MMNTTSRELTGQEIEGGLLFRPTALASGATEDEVREAWGANAVLVVETRSFDGESTNRVSWGLARPPHISRHSSVVTGC